MLAPNPAQAAQAQAQVLAVQVVLAAQAVQAADVAVPAALAEQVAAGIVSQWIPQRNVRRNWTFTKQRSA
jgi:hypothetical protein